MELQLALGALDILLDRVRYVCRMAIQHQEYVFALAAHEVFQKCDEISLLQGVRIDLAPERSLHTHRANHFDLLPLTAGLDDRRLALQPIGPPQVGLRTEPCL